MPCFYRGHDLGTPEGCMTRDCLAMLGVDPVAVAARQLLRNAKGKTQESKTRLSPNPRINAGGLHLRFDRETD